MDKSFNELFDDFFKRNKIRPEDGMDDSIKDEILKMIDMLSKFNDVEMNEDFEDLEKEIDEEFGKPDKVEFYNENELFIEKRIWYTPDGELVKLIVSDDPSLLSKPKKTLEQQLKEAVESEDYEKAALIRDQINKK
jgi:hypothetical protein